MLRCSAGCASLAIKRPTATKDSQKPAWLIAQGSIAVTTTAATSSASGQGHRRPKLRRTARLVSIQTVRWAGTPQPENSA